MKIERTAPFGGSGNKTGPVRGRAMLLGLVMMAACLVAPATMSYAALVGLTGATASAQQDGDANLISKSIDGVYDSNNGWGLYPYHTSNQTAVFQTSNPEAAGSEWIFNLYFYQFSAGHKIQQFRLSATTSANPTVNSGATWTTLNPSDVSTYWAGGTLTSTINPDNTVLVSGLRENSGQQAIWTVHASGLLNPTGFRLEVFPVNDGIYGATIGFQKRNDSTYNNGNISLTEFTANAVPLPPSLLLLGSGLIGLLGVGWKLRKP